MEYVNYFYYVEKLIEIENFSSFDWIHNLTEFQSYCLFESNEAETVLITIPAELRFKASLSYILTVLDSAKDYIEANFEHESFFLACRFDNGTGDKASLIVDPNGGADFRTDFTLSLEFAEGALINGALKDLSRDEVICGLCTISAEREIWLGYKLNGKVKSISSFVQ